MPLPSPGQDAQKTSRVVLPPPPSPSSSSSASSNKRYQEPAQHSTFDFSEVLAARSKLRKSETQSTTSDNQQNAEPLKSAERLWSPVPSNQTQTAEALKRDTRRYSMIETSSLSARRGLTTVPEAEVPDSPSPPPPPPPELPDDEDDETPPPPPPLSDI